MKKLAFICTILGISSFEIDTTYGMNPLDNNVEVLNNQMNDVDTSSGYDDSDTDNLDPYDVMYRNTTGELTEEEICAFVNASVSAFCTLGSVLIMGGKICFTNFDSDIDTGNRINTMINQILIFTGIGIATNIALRYLRPNMTDYNRRHNCLLLYLLLATTCAVWSENSNALTTEATLDDLGLFISAQSMYGLAALGGFFLGEALHCE